MITFFKLKSEFEEVKKEDVIESKRRLVSAKKASTDVINGFL